MTSTQFFQGLLLAALFYAGWLLGRRLFIFARRAYFNPKSKNQHALKTLFKNRIHTPMDEAVFTGDAPRVLELARQGMAVRKLMLWELTSVQEPPHRIWASEALFRALLQAGADVRVRYLAGSKGIAGYETFETPLSNAIQAQRLDLVKLFLEHGADPNTPIDNGHPMRSRACRVLDLVQDGTTPFARQATELLLQYGAKPEPMRHFGRSALF